jgi:hypothetical protein
LPGIDAKSPPLLDEPHARHHMIEVNVPTLGGVITKYVPK